MIKSVIPIAYTATQADIDAGLANNLPKGTPIIIIDANQQPIDIKVAQGGGLSPVDSSGIKNNFTATSVPLVTNDNSQGYSIGSRWIDTIGVESYICLDSTVGSAIWSKTTVGTITEVAGLQSVLDSKSSTAHNHDTTYTVIAHGINTLNPHSVTKTQVGLGSADNTADISKPVSTAQQTALDGKSATTHNHTGTYEPANTNIQSHIFSTHAPSNAEQNINADWNAVSGDAQILNKPTIPVIDFTDWTSYTPVVSTESGGWTNYTATGRYRIVNRMLTVSFRVIFTGVSAATSGLYVSLPAGLTMNASVMTGGASWDTDLVGLGILGDSGTVSGVPAIITTRTNQKIIVKYYSWNGTYMVCPGISNTTPWTWANQDTVDGEFTVPIV